MVEKGPALNQTGSSQVEAGETVAREKCRHRLVSTASVRVENEAMPPLSFSRTHTTLRDSPRPSLAYAFVRHSKPQSFYLLGRSDTNRRFIIPSVPSTTSHTHLRQNKAITPIHITCVHSRTCGKQVFSYRVRLFLVRRLSNESWVRD